MRVVARWNANQFCIMALWFWFGTGAGVGSYSFTHCSTVRRRPATVARRQVLLALNECVSAEQIDQGREEDMPDKLVIHWKGEGIEGYSMQFRQLEFCGALAAVSNIETPLEEVLQTLVRFNDALDYTGEATMSDFKIVRFNQAMQYITFSAKFSRQVLIDSAKRCSLVHALYEVVSDGSDYEQLAERAIQNGGFDDMLKEKVNGMATWCVRVRHYGQISGKKKERRYGGRTRSMTMEREALQVLEPLLERFGGGVDLDNPDVKIYIFDGLKKESVALARRLVVGALASNIAPTTRICITNTPLCPIASFALCNVAGIKAQHKVLDPYAGSAAILLAAAMIESSCKTVGIEIAHNGLVNRDDIRMDFSTRKLSQPLALLHGDCTDELIRTEARKAIDNQPFDLIISDPPYGVRESTMEMSPINELLGFITIDRDANRRILKLGGKLVCFIPCQEDETLLDVMPTDDMLADAGLVCEVTREQPLNTKLSRWLVSFVCVR